MSDLDNKKKIGQDTENEKKWEEIRKKLKRKMNNLDPLTSKVQKRVTEIQEQENRKKDCFIKGPFEINHKGEQVLNREDYCDCGPETQNAPEAENIGYRKNQEAMEAKNKSDQNKKQYEAFMEKPFSDAGTSDRHEEYSPNKNAPKEESTKDYPLFDSMLRSDNEPDQYTQYLIKKRQEKEEQDEDKKKNDIIRETNNRLDNYNHTPNDSIINDGDKILSNDIQLDISKSQEQEKGETINEKSNTRKGTNDKPLPIQSNTNNSNMYYDSRNIRLEANNVDSLTAEEAQKRQEQEAYEKWAKQEESLNNIQQQNQKQQNPKTAKSEEQEDKPKNENIQFKSLDENNQPRTEDNNNNNKNNISNNLQNRSEYEDSRPGVDDHIINMTQTNHMQENSRSSVEDNNNTNNTTFDPQTNQGYGNSRSAIEDNNTSNFPQTKPSDGNSRSSVVSPDGVWGSLGRSKPLIPLIEDDLEGPERSGIILLRAIQAGSLAATELDPDERRVIVKLLKDQGRTQDEISAMLQVSRRTIVSDYKYLRMQAAEFVKNLDTYDVAGEVWDQAHNAIQKALHDNKFRTVSQILRDMVEMLQSMGVLYRAPTTSKVASIVGHVQAHQGYTNYLEQVGDEKDRVVDVLKAMMSSIEKREF